MNTKANTQRPTASQLTMLKLVGITDDGYTIGDASGTDLAELRALTDAGFTSMRRTRKGQAWRLTDAGLALLRKVLTVERA